MPEKESALSAIQSVSLRSMLSLWACDKGTFMITTMTEVRVNNTSVDTLILIFMIG